jgi:predicted Zn-dependent protease with MMP-like domain
MKHEHFEDIIRETIERLPDWAREAMHNVAVHVLDEADDELDPHGEGLLGLYMGVPLPERDANHAGELPDVIYVFRNPHLDMGLPPAELRDEIEKTVIHEIAHYFGIDDDHLDDIGWG